MSVSRTELAALLAPQQESFLAKRFLRDVEPLCRAAEAGELHLAEAERVNEDNLGKAIAAATRKEVAMLATVSAKGNALSGNIHHEDAYDSFLTLALRRSRRDEYLAAHGPDSLERLVDPLWNCLCGDLVAATRRSCGDFFDSVHHTLAHDVAYAAAVTVAYGVAYVAVGDEKNYGELRELLRLLPWVLPIGTPAGSGGLWLALVQ